MIHTVSVVLSKRSASRNHVITAGGLEPELWHNKSYLRPAERGWCWCAPNKRIFNGATVEKERMIKKDVWPADYLDSPSKKDAFGLQFMSNWTDASTGVARWWFIALHVNLEFKSCLLKRSTTISLRRLRPLGTRKVSLDIGLPSRSQVTFGVGRPPNTSHFSFIVLPSLYGPTTLFRSVFDSSRILMRSGGTARFERNKKKVKLNANKAGNV